MKNQGFAPVLIVLLVALGAGLFFAGTYFANNFEINKKTQDTATYTPVASYEPTSDATSNWKTYTNSTVGYQIKYPSDWKVNLATPTPAQKESGGEHNVLTITKGNYSLELITSKIGGGGIICQFDDSTATEFAGPATDKLGKSYEIGTFLGKKARRNLNPISSVSQYGSLRQEIDYTYEVCVPTAYSNGEPYEDGKLGYTSTVNANDLIVYNEYHTPLENIDQNILKTMDQIITSLEFY